MEKESLMWYHGKIGKESSEKILLVEYEKNKREKGVFLVRDSKSINFKFVLSCYHKDYPIHYSIKQHGCHPVFSINGDNPIDGLEKLIKFYQENNADDDLGVSLSSFIFVRGALPPREYCSTEKPLNVKPKISLYDVVREIQSKEKSKRGFAEGQSKSVCIENHAGVKNAVAKFSLLKMNSKKPQFEPEKEKHSEGRTQGVERCQSIKAPISCNYESEETSLQTSSEITRKVSVDTTKEKLTDIWKQAPKILMRKLSQEGSTLLIDSNKKSGKYLTENESKSNVTQPFENDSNKVRKDYYSGIQNVRSSKTSREISLIAPQRIENPLDDILKAKSGLRSVKVHKTASVIVNKVADNVTEKFEQEPSEVIRHSLDESSLKETKDVLEKFLLKRLTEMAKKTAQENDKPVQKTSENIKEENIYDIVRPRESVPTTDNIKTDGCYINNKNLQISSENVGSGQYGAVLKGILVEPGRCSSVVIKTLNSIEDDTCCAFLREAATTIDLDNPFIIKMIGVVKGPPMRIVQEFAHLGRLSEYIKVNGDSILVTDINVWATQIAVGMHYLETKNLVHRDLAARNVLVATKRHVKICDFGLSRRTSSKCQSFSLLSTERVPIKWFAPECFGGSFSHASDVWSFGVTLWEVYSKGEDPYNAMAGQDVIDFVIEGRRLPKPKLCPDEIYQIMLQCWQRSTKTRPTFMQLVRYFKHMGQENRDSLKNIWPEFSLYWTQ